jgi:hypothetical protein
VVTAGCGDKSSARRVQHRRARALTAGAAQGAVGWEALEKPEEEEACFDEGILSLCRPISLLYGESLQVQKISVTNDRAPSHENRPANTVLLSSCSPSPTSSATPSGPRRGVKCHNPYILQ